MGETFNPYAPPREASEPEPKSGGVWRHGDLLVVSHEVLPSTKWCIKSNERATNETEFSFHWHAPAWYLLAPLVVPYVLALPFVSRQINIPFGLNRANYYRRRWRTIVGVVCLCVTMVCFLYSLVEGFNLLPHTMADPGGEAGNIYLRGYILQATASVTCLFFAIGVALNYFDVRAVRITTGHTFIRGVHPGFLARFPKWAASNR